MKDVEHWARRQRRVMILVFVAMLVFYVALRFTLNWFGVPRTVGTATCLGLSLLVFFLVYVRYARRETQRLEYANRVCPHCEYPLDAPSGQCPECGTVYTMPEVLAYWDAVEDKARRTKPSPSREPDENDG